MSVRTARHSKREETTYSTKSVFMRAEYDDELKITEVISKSTKKEIPKVAKVVSRDLTYYGPRIRIQDEGEQFVLTISGPESEAIFWTMTEDGWDKTAEVCIDFADSLPQYDICLQCNEPISTIQHRRRSISGTCNL